MSSEKPVEGGPYLPLAACLALCWSGPLSGLAQGGLGPILPQMTAHFSHVPDAGVLVRLMVSGLIAAMIVGALVSGFLAERIGEVRLLLICLVLYGLSGAAGFFLDNLYLIVGSRLVLGAVFSAMSGVALALVTTDVAPEARDRWIGWFVVSGSVGVVLLTLIVGVLGKYDWRYVFLLYLIALPIALYTALVFPPRDKVAHAAARADAASGRMGIPWRLMLITLACGAVGITAFMYLPYHLATIGQGRPEQVAPVMAASTVFGSLSSTCFGWLRRHVSAAPVFVAALLLIATGLLVIVSTAERAVLFGGIALYGTGLGVLIPNLYSACAAATPALFRPRIVGLIRATFYTSPLLAQILLEVVQSRFGPSAALAAIALIALVGALLAVLLRRAFVPVEEAAAYG